MATKKTEKSTDTKAKAAKKAAAAKASSKAKAAKASPIRRLLLPEEEAGFRNYKRPVRFLAMRFAAKEAIVKALGTGFAHGIWVRDVGIAPNAWGRPEVIWSERGRALRDKLGAGEGHVTLTDEAGLVMAVA